MEDQFAMSSSARLFGSGVEKNSELSRRNPKMRWFHCACAFSLLCQEPQLSSMAVLFRLLKL